MISAENIPDYFKNTGIFSTAWPQCQYILALQKLFHVRKAFRNQMALPFVLQRHGHNLRQLLRQHRLQSGRNPQCHQPGSGPECGDRCHTSRAGQPGGACKDGDPAKGPLVSVPRPLPKPPCRFPVVQREHAGTNAFCTVRRKPDGTQMDTPGKIPARKQNVAWFQIAKGNGVIGPHRCSLYLGRLPVDTGGNVNRHDRACTFIGFPDHSGIVSFDRPVQAGTEQAVDDQKRLPDHCQGASGILPILQTQNGKGYAIRTRILFLQGLQDCKIGTGIPRRIFPAAAQDQNRHPVAGQGEMPGYRQSVSSVVAAAGKNQDPAGPAKKGQRIAFPDDVRYPNSRVLHENHTGNLKFRICPMIDFFTLGRSHHIQNRSPL